MKGYLLLIWYALKNFLTKGKLVDENSMFDVALTSHGDRVGRAFGAIESACGGGVKPRRIILFLSQEDWHGPLPKSLIRLCRRGLEVITCENDGPHKKMQPYLRMNACFARPLITIDDDVFYEPVIFNNLYNAWLTDKLHIHCLRARSIALRGDMLMPYVVWPLCKNSDPSHAHFSTGVGGVLYPPDFLVAIKGAGCEFREKCPEADDVWVNAHAVRFGFRVKQASIEPSRRPDIPGSRSTALFKKNIRLGGNDEQLARVYDRDLIYTLLSECSRRSEI